MKLPLHAHEFLPVEQILPPLFLLSQVMVQATMAVYKAAVSTFLPTPSKSHYVFNLRDFSRVVRGVLLVPKTHMKEGDKLTRLWVHEIYRVFYDRLIDDKDRCVRGERERDRKGEEHVELRSLLKNTCC